MLQPVTLQVCSIRHPSSASIWPWNLLKYKVLGRTPNILSQHGCAESSHGYIKKKKKIFRWFLVTLSFEGYSFLERCKFRSENEEKVRQKRRCRKTRLHKVIIWLLSLWAHFQIGFTETSVHQKEEILPPISFFSLVNVDSKVS